MEIEARIKEHMLAVADGDLEAWKELLRIVEPIVDRLANNQPVGRLRGDEDARRDTVANVISKLHANDFRSIRRFLEQSDPPPLEAWIRVLVRSAAIDVMRARPEFRRANAHRGPEWISLATLATQAGVATPSTLAAKQREVETFMDSAVREAEEAHTSDPDSAAASLAQRWRVPILHTRRLVKRRGLYNRVLKLVLNGFNYVEVAEKLQLSRREVELLVGYMEELLHARGFAS